MTRQRKALFGPRGLMLSLFIIGLTVGLIQACSAPADSSDTASPKGFTSCETPRPEMCTREYRPVCGHVDTGIRCVKAPCPSERHKTYGNDCSACADKKVIGFEQGTCESYGK
ncbi:hypothetical protein IMCC21906_01561 [Spongiibacter sp. IMCC21906]|jgi:hypothetical protein|uniref:hypothetical protein n=1 Tax=Spongiibacter sp. IMCC21906 TaxID=1620392 RepID=UPI00062DF844|nr:hypothetical protein [Spongiibacter sp. IMCC21906]AKH69239.1 hypothetical protein IMCC21906_01561 [Spongiibacter sp. IMCC21906]